MYIVCSIGIFNPEQRHVLYVSKSLSNVKKYIAIITGNNLTKLEYIEVYKRMKIMEN